MIPAGLKYTETHEWAKEMGKNMIRVGITDHAQAELGDIVYVNLPEIGKEISKGDEIVEVESVKAVEQILSPVSGKVIAVNEALEDDPALLNSDCYEEGWICEIEMSDPSELEALLDDKKYKEIAE
ncbi:MAG TPA: glycine cleavage system protein GcvH [Candidatus Mcinerneyibacteriales bacterium]|nr:glycine cleavage system protein GcvH [Candidatus Mcinerneyibacteriales bacterium]HPE19701.1 glycine cleavage system protein GcvH [Candidatus Mcinerneyibacteriales bacterium]HPJ70825.1 glycine cleavage system protein GcvH [Candidatus Mcinerneyibacteriales bacterium]HPQ88703.1 glycine cleavage system protein GcvH [Candidatus Mcinerneyibacteriales bacterium]